MLVLTRKPGETLVIGQDIRVTVERIAGNQVKLSIEAPRDVPILRAELERHDASDQPASPGGAPPP